jgi:LuxR family transcriptional regulator, maltose regulon positive regulatory protein
LKIPIIGTKLLIPAIKDNFIRRSKLTRKLKKMTDYPLTLIHAGAGYGKSTALSLFMLDEKQVGCWYSISATDDDILPFLTYLVHSIRHIHPSFGKELLSYMNQMDRYIREEELNLLGSLFINEILTIESKITIILDDFHQIEHSYSINRWMETFLEHNPHHVHIVLSSRRRPTWKMHKWDGLTRRWRNYDVKRNPDIGIPFFFWILIAQNISYVIILQGRNNLYIIGGVLKRKFVTYFCLFIVLL